MDSSSVTAIANETTSLEHLRNHVARLKYATGLDLYAVGGCVRDSIISRRIHDYDFTCNTPPDNMEDTLKRTTGKKVYTIGKRFGTVAFKDEHLGMVEITTFRGEKYEDGKRKPIVQFVQELEKDLSRRDFTMNAMALDAAGNLHDPFKGKNDLESGIIKCVGDAAERFTEDPLRMLRAIRFAVQLRHVLDEAVVQSIQRLRIRILSISKQRIVSELDAMFSHDGKKAVELLYETGLLSILFTEFNGIPHSVIFDHCFHDADVLGWKWLLGRICQFIVSRRNDGTTNMYVDPEYIEILYRDIVEKYILHYKLSKKMKESLLDNVLGHKKVVE